MSSPSAVLTRPDRDAATIVGYEVQTPDGAFGTIAEETVLIDSGHLVVKTGFWILERKHLVPSAVVAEVDHETNTVTVSMGHEELKTTQAYIENNGTNQNQRRQERQDISHRPATIL